MNAEANQAGLAAGGRVEAVRDEAGERARAEASAERRRVFMKRLAEVVGWLTAILLFIYASRAVFA